MVGQVLAQLADCHDGSSLAPSLLHVSHGSKKADYTRSIDYRTYHVNVYLYIYIYIISYYIYIHIRIYIYTFRVYTRCNHIYIYMYMHVYVCTGSLSAGY